MPFSVLLNLVGTSNASNESGNNPCIILQSGQDDTMWEDREMITLMEGGWNLHSSSTTDTATIEIELLDGKTGWISNDQIRLIQ